MLVWDVTTKPYSKLCAELSGATFTPADVRRVLGSTPGSTRVIVSRLMGAGQIIPLERGKYRLVRQENLIKLHELKTRNPKLYQLALEVYQKLPDLKMLALYGSQVAGVADEFSDCDVLVVSEKVLEKGEKRKFKQELERKLGIKLHLTIWSERSYRTFILTEPHLKFWLSEAIILDEGGLSWPLPPTAKWGYKEALHVAEGYIDIGDDALGPRRAAYYLTPLKIVLMVEHALNLDYSYKKVREELERLVGKDLVQATREDRFSPKGIKKKQIEELRKIAREKLRKVRIKLSLLGENESDLYLKELMR